MKIVKPLKMEPLKLMIPSVKPRGGLLECESERRWKGRGEGSKKLKPKGGQKNCGKT